MAKSKGPSRDKRGYYTIKKVPHVSVTTFLKIINLPFLYKWYATMERKGIIKIIDKLTKKGHLKAAVLRQEILNYCHKKLVAAERYMYKRGDAGNIIHKAIDRYLATGKKPHFKKTKHKKVFKRWLRWWDASGYEVIKTEVIASDLKLRTAGTIDAYVRHKKTKKRGILDWKTGKNIYLKDYLQNVTYRHLARKTLPSDFGLIVRVPQDGGKIKEHKVDEKKYTLRFALHALDLWRDVNE